MKLHRTLLFAMALPLSAQDNASSPNQESSGLVEVNRIAATVNARPITAKEVGVMLGPEIARLAAEFPRRGPEFQRQVKEARDRVLQELIDRELILSEFAKMQAKGANLPDHVVDQEIERQIQNLYGGDRQKFRDELSQARMGMASYRELTREKLIVQALRSEKFKDTAPPLPSEIQKEYQLAKDSLRDTSQDQLTYRKIYLSKTDPTNPLATPDSQLELAESLVEKLENGADFAELAKKHSADAFAQDGGLQKEIPREDLSPEFAAILFDAKVDKTLGPLEDRTGFTIAKVESLKKGPAPPLSEVKDLIKERVRAKKTSERYEKWIEQLRDDAVIQMKSR